MYIHMHVSMSVFMIFNCLILLVLCIHTEYKKLKEASPQIMSQSDSGGMNYESMESGMYAFM